MNSFLSFFLVSMVVALATAQAPVCDERNNWQLFPDHQDCANYYRCEDNEAVLHTCVENLLYDHELRACNWDDLREDCSNNDDDFIPHRPVVRCPPHENNERPTHLSHPMDCGKFYKCWDGEPVLMDCPTGMFWNPTDMYCDFPKNVRCNNGFRPAEM